METEPLLVGETVTVGDLQVIPVSDGQLRFTATDFFPHSTDADWAPERHGRWLTEEGRLALAMTSFVIRAPGATVLVVCGLNFDDGGDWRGGRLPEALAAAAITPEEIDVVVLTHLHLDHVGLDHDRGGRRASPLLLAGDLPVPRRRLGMGAPRAARCVRTPPGARRGAAGSRGRRRLGGPGGHDP